jgi:hypothetical protein
VLNFDSAEGSLKTPGEMPNNDDTVADAQMNGAENVDSGEDDGDDGDGEESIVSTIIEQEGDLSGYTLTEADRLLHTVYGDYVHQNSGQQMCGGVVDDQQWQDYWRQLMSTHP